ncbi:hypothetical protein M407DRAFT_242547 [Tulasnella calospora MUT 4182]|uniref:Uncharacterized protein n=1 Tax=Tulasnella calospora MUT 4182 TaxID=1051891 RepID=A0A0C3M783_9AGAM|nr:hypothetical protein M407DRAFT_242547 [Tulasnella calospora MUT 4182]
MAKTRSGCHPSRSGTRFCLQLSQLCKRAPKNTAPSQFEYPDVPCDFTLDDIEMPIMRRYGNGELVLCEMQLVHRLWV